MSSTRLFDGIYQIASPLGDRVLYQYLLSGNRSLLVDTGTRETPAKTTIPFMESIGLKKDHLTVAINTHCDADHFGGNSELRRLAPRTLLAAHREDREQIEDPDLTMKIRYNAFSADHGIEYAPEVKSSLRAMMGDRCSLDILLQGGEVFRLSDDWGVEILHVPGHSHGHIAIWDPRNKAVIIGDAVMGRYIPTANGRPALAPTYMYPDEYLSTIRLIKQLKPETLLTSHYPNMDSEQAQKFLDESAIFAREADHQILKALRATNEPLTLRELIAKTAEKLTPIPENARMDLAFPFAGHLTRLEKLGKIHRARKRGLVAWRIVQRPRKRRRI
jgi:glyoxylase-like metal-dependent hydrolase (beta-lactamase superfamily II)